MKGKLNFSGTIISLIAASLLFLAGCSDNGAGTITSDIFESATTEVAPGFSSSRAASWTLGTAIYELYGVLNSAGTPVGYFNLYDLVKEADDSFTALSSGSTPIGLQEISLPDAIDIGFSGTDATYDIYRSDDTYKTFGKVDGSAYRLLYICEVDRTDEKSKRVVQGIYDEATGDLDLRMFYANYVSSYWEKGYAFVSGNTTSHQFTLRILRDGFGYDHNMVGYGVSEGAGYFLMKLANNTMDMTTAKYYEFDASNLTVTALQLMDDAGSATVPANTTGYESTINSITPLAEGRLPTAEELDSMNLMGSVIYN